MKLEDVKSYADLRDYLFDQQVKLRACCNWHARVGHQKKAAELNSRIAFLFDIYRKMLEISDREQGDNQ